MKNRQVPRAEWHRFFEAFNRRHRSSLASVAVLSAGYGAQTQARSLPLDGVVADASGRTLSILLGGPTAHVDHPVDDPQSVWIELDDSGAELAVEIESGQGTRTILEFDPGTSGGVPTLIREGERP